MSDNPVDIFPDIKEFNAIDYEVPCYVYSYFTEKESNINMTTHAQKTHMSAQEQREYYRGRIAREEAMRRELLPPPVRNPGELGEHMESTKIAELRKRALERTFKQQQWPDPAKIKGATVLIRIGEYNKIYECIVHKISDKGKAIFIKPTTNKLQTISAKQSTWWSLCNVEFVDSISDNQVRDDLNPVRTIK